MRVEVLQARHPVGHKRVGEIIEAMPDGQARGLERRGIVRQAIVPADRMMRSAQTERKGRR